jgi:hypothetical protein
MSKMEKDSKSYRQSKKDVRIVFKVVASTVSLQMDELLKAVKKYTHCEGAELVVVDVKDIQEESEEHRLFYIKLRSGYYVSINYPIHTAFCRNIDYAKCFSSAASAYNFAIYEMGLETDSFTIDSVRDTHKS